jgi:hypothetical protein
MEYPTFSSLPDYSLALNVHPEVLRPAKSTQVFLIFLCLETNTEVVARLQVATACFSNRLPDLNKRKLNSSAGNAIKLSFQNIQFSINVENQNSIQCKMSLRGKPV